MNNPLPGIVKDEDFNKWIDQFDENDKPSIQRILPYFRYYSSDDVFKLLRVLYKKLVNEYGITESTTLFVPVGYISKSGAAISYFFRRENNLDETNFVALSDLTKRLLCGYTHIVFLDDYIGSGSYMNSIKEEYIKVLPQVERDRISFICACVVGYQQGIDKISDKCLNVCVADVISYKDQPLHAYSTAFSSEEKADIRRILLKYNEPLKPSAPMGFGNIEGLVSFFFATPNNTFPIFWSSENEWFPLFPRGDSRRNPNRLIVLPSYLQEDKIFSSDFNSNIVFSEKTTKALYNRFLSLDKMNIMAEIFYSLKINDEFAESIANAIDFYQDLEHEQKKVFTSFFIINSKYKDNAMPELIADGVDIFLDDFENTKKHLLVVNGLSSTLAFDNTGKVLGILKYSKSPEDNTDSTQLDKYKPMEFTSSKFHGLLVVFTDDNRVLLYFNGNRLMTKKGKDWHVQGNLDNLSEIAVSHGIKTNVLDKAMQIAYRLSDEKEGGLLCIGDEENVRNNSSQMGSLQYKFHEKNITKADEISLTSLAKQDGAMIIAGNGTIIDSMMRLEPSQDISIEPEGDKGTRHNTAKKMSKITKAIFITISADGPISIYADGNRIMKMLG